MQDPDPDQLLLNDPDLPPGELAEIATRRPDLHVQIAMSPTAYPELLEWLATSDDTAVQEAVQQAIATPLSKIPSQGLSAPRLTSYGTTSFELEEPERPEPHTPNTPPEPPEPPRLPAHPAPTTATEDERSSRSGSSRVKEGGRWLVPALLAGAAVIVAAVAIWFWSGTHNGDHSPTAAQSEANATETQNSDREEPSGKEETETDKGTDASEAVSDESSGGPQVMDPNQIALGNYSSVQGTWKNDVGQTVTITGDTLEFSKWPDFVVRGAIPQGPCDGTWKINTRLSPTGAAFVWQCVGSDGERQSVRSIFFLPDSSGSEELVVRDNAGLDSETFWSLDDSDLEAQDKFRRD